MILSQSDDEFIKNSKYITDQNFFGKYFLVKWESSLFSYIPLPERPRRIIPGMKKCNNCPICPFVTTGQTVKSTQTNYSVDINMSVDCRTKNQIYMLGCKKCQVQYIGETHRTLQDRFSEHLGYVRNSHINKVTGEHFNSKGHKQSDMSRA